MYVREKKLEFRSLFASGRLEHFREFMERLNELTSLYNEKVLDEKDYHDLLNLAISIYVANAVTSRVGWDLDRAFGEKLSPHRLISALL